MTILKVNRICIKFYSQVKYINMTAVKALINQLCILPIDRSYIKPNCIYEIGCHSFNNFLLI